MLFGVNMVLCDKVNVRRATLLIKPVSKRSQRFCRRRSFIILSARCWIFITSVPSERCEVKCDPA